MIIKKLKLKQKEKELIKRRIKELAITLIVDLAFYFKIKELAITLIVDLAFISI